MDGIATGVTGIIALAYVTLPGSLMSPFARIVAASVAGACTGFLPFNWPPAKIYLGDCGATPLGFVVAFLSLDYYRARPPATSALLFPLLVVALPLLDAVFAAIRRVRGHTSPLQGDRKHMYDLAGARGWPVRRIIFSMYAVTASFATIGFCAVRNPSPLLWTGAAIGVGLFVCAAIRLGSFRAGDSNESAGTASGESMNREFT